MHEIVSDFFFLFAEHRGADRKTAIKFEIDEQGGPLLYKSLPRGGKGGEDMLQIEDLQLRDLTSADPSLRLAIDARVGGCVRGRVVRVGGGQGESWCGPN